MTLFLFHKFLGRSVGLQSTGSIFRADIFRKFHSSANLSCATNSDDSKFLEGVTIVDSIEKAKDVVRILRSDDLLAVPHACDTEVVDIDLKARSPVGQGKIISASIFCGPDVDFGSGPRLWIDNLDEAEGTLDVFKEYFSDERCKKVFHNFSFDNHVLVNNGCEVRGFVGDTMHIARLWDSARAKYSLESLSDDVLGARKAPIKERFGVRNVRKDGSFGKIVKFPELVDVQRDPLKRAEWIHYCVYDAESTWLLHENLKAKLKKMQWIGDATMWDFYQKYLIKFGQTLVDMETYGFFLNTKHLADMEKLAIRDKEVQENIFRQWAQEQCGDCKFMNIGSSSQVQQLLFGPIDSQDKHKSGLPPSRTFTAPNTDGYIEPGKEKPKKSRPFIIQGMGLKPISKTKKGSPQASQDVITKLAGEPTEQPPKYGKAFSYCGDFDKGKDVCLALHALARSSAIGTLLGTFIKPLQTMPDEKGRLHFSLNLNTETGRLSCRTPNLQNQPNASKDFYHIRDAFAAEPGKTLIVADYGQLELRVLAHMANCRSMIEAFHLGGDFHSRTAMSMYPEIKRAVESKEVLLEWDDKQGKAPVPLLKSRFSAERQKAKIFNFSIAYGKTAQGFAKDFDVSVKEAKDTLELWYKDRQEVKMWQNHTIANARETGYTRTLMGRYRRLPEINAPNKYHRLQSERASINTPIQGGAADIVMMAMNKIHFHQRLKELGWKLILQIHDEVILEGPTESTEEASAIVKQCMERPFQQSLLVELTVDLKSAPTWFQGK
eukprot:797889_1